MRRASVVLLLGAVSLTPACNEFLDVNTNPNSPQDVSANLYLPPMIHWMVTSPQFDGRFVGHYTQQWISTSTLATSPAITWGHMGYQAGSDNGAQQWRDVYWSLGQNLVAMNTKAQAEQRWDLLARLLHDDTLDLTDRVAGSLVLCYAQQLSRITAMTTDQVTRHHDGHTTIRFGADRVTVPEPLAGLIGALIDTRRSHVGVGSPATSRWLFPGHHPGRPLTPAHLGVRLRRLGIPTMAARRAALLHLASQLPAAVLADLLNLSTSTAVGWVHNAGGDWSRYAASLAQEGHHRPHE